MQVQCTSLKSVFVVPMCPPAVYYSALILLWLWCSNSQIVFTFHQSGAVGAIFHLWDFLLPFMRRTELQTFCFRWLCLFLSWQFMCSEERLHINKDDYNKPVWHTKKGLVSIPSLHACELGPCYVNCDPWLANCGENIPTERSKLRVTEILVCF